MSWKSLVTAALLCVVASPVFAAPTLWKGSVTLPALVPIDGVERRHRLAIAEYEEYLVDDEDPYDQPVKAKGRRMVFIEYVEL